MLSSKRHTMALALLLAPLLLLFAPSVARADPDADVVALRHRIGFAAGAGLAVVVYQTEDLVLAGGLGASLRASYGYQIVTGLEAGVDAAVLFMGFQALIGDAHLRYYVPIGQTVELGLTGRFGGCVAPDHPAYRQAISGLSYGATIDTTVWLNPGLGVQGLLDATLGKLNNPASETSLRTQPSFSALTLGAGVVARL